MLFFKSFFCFYLMESWRVVYLGVRVLFSRVVYFGVWVSFSWFVFFAEVFGVVIDFRGFFGWRVFSYIWIYVVFSFWWRKVCFDIK